MEATIEVAGLRKRFGPQQALDGMTFTVQPGQVTGFVGPNGAGKSTTIKMLCTLVQPTAGSALVAGHDVQRRAAGRGRAAAEPFGAQPPAVAGPFAGAGPAPGR